MKEFKSLNKLVGKLEFVLAGARQWLLVVAISSLPMSGVAQEKATRVSPVDSLLPMLGGLLVILGFIFLLAFLFKRFTNFSPSSKNIKVLETQMIGTKEKLVIVKVQQQSFLIGVTANSISQLGELNMDSLNGESENSDSTNQTDEKIKATLDTPSFKSVLSSIVKNSMGIKNSSKNIDKLAG
jgi:flagellar biosynthetic protein FliO